MVGVVLDQEKAVISHEVFKESEEAEEEEEEEGVKS